MVIELTPEQRAEGERLAKEGNLFGAVLLVRTATGAPLDVAVALARTWLPARDAGDDDGSSSEVLAVGPFAPAIASHLDYPADRFDGTPGGAIIVTQVFWTYRSRAQLTALSTALGFEPRDVNTHAIDARHVDAEPLRVWFDREVDAFLALRTAGFSFFFYGPFPSAES